MNTADPVPVGASLGTLATIEIPNELELLALLDALRKLERDFKLGHRFNLFEALNTTKQETRHSRFLAYLLDPHETHGLSDRFLRALLLAAADGHPQLPVTRLAVAIRDLSDASVHCERDHFDISVQLPSLGLLFVIENKVDASESENQLTTYRLRAQQRHPDYQFMGCFLTRDGYEGGDAHWGTLSYAAVAAEIRTVLTDTTPPAEVLVALKHYIDLIERRIVTSQALIDACREIYKTHKTAFDLVMEHGQQSLLSLAFEEFVAANTHLAATATRSETLFFLHKDWPTIPRTLVADRKRWTSQFPVVFWFQLGEKKLQLRLEIGPVATELAAARAELVQRFRSAYATNAAKASPTYTRVLTTSEKLPEDPTMDDLLTAMNDLWKKWDTNHGGPQRVADLVRDWAQTLPSKPV